MRAGPVLALAIASVAIAGCDRNMEPFVPGEKPRQPDLSKIFPAGAERSAEAGAGARVMGSQRGASPMFLGKTMLLLVSCLLFCQLTCMTGPLTRPACG